jgi:ferredoxin
MATIDPGFATEIKKYGAKDFQACFSCGTCTAVCNLTGKDASFPRLLIRKGMLGQKKDILASKELWLCYACGECGINCPRQAHPDEYMASVRRYAIAGYDPSGLTKLIFKNNWFSVLITLVLAAILGFFLFTLKPESEVARWIFKYMPFSVIHDMGMVIFIFAGLAMAAGLFRMIYFFMKSNQAGKPAGLFSSLSEVGKEMSLMKRYRTCNDDDIWEKKSWIVKPWFLHWSVMWGFLGLLLATILDFIFKDPATTIWWPSRVLGTIAGLLMMYGTTVLMYYRLKKVTVSYARTALADWMFLIFLWLAGFTGFWLEAVVSFGGDNLANHIVFVIHTIISMELVILFVFSKFAHAVYRPLALFFHIRRTAV